MDSERSMNLVLTCRICNVLQAPILVRPKDYQSWKRGELIQRAMPYLTPAEREMYISQTCALCWEAMFAD
jgi:hypothetical protein